jgi:hypothetical protein
LLYYPMFRLDRLLHRTRDDMWQWMYQSSKDSDELGCHIDNIHTVGTYCIIFILFIFSWLISLHHIIRNVLSLSN